MKKLLILFSAAFLVVSCNDTKDANDKKDDKDSGDKKEDVKRNDAKKPDTTGKVVLHDHFQKVEEKDLTKDDHSGWPEDRKNEVKQMCLKDIGYDGPEAQAYCNCQLDNAMKIFASYKEAMAIYTKEADELTEAEVKKLMQMEETDMSCMEQNYKEDMEDEDGDEKDGM